MNYELKSIAPGSIFWNAVRIFSVLGFMLGVLSFFIVTNSPQMRAAPFWLKLLGTFGFTAVYTLVVSLLLTFVALLYNVYASRYKGIRVRLQQQP